MWRFFLFNFSYIQGRESQFFGPLGPFIFRVVYAFGPLIAGRQTCHDDGCIWDLCAWSWCYSTWR